MIINRTLVGLVALSLSACTAFGGGGSQENTTLALAVDAGASAAATVGLIRDTGAEIVLVSSSGDSSWFAALARETRLNLSGPGRAGAAGLAFLTERKAVGDTTLALAVEGGDSLIVHDALYDLGRRRHLDLLVFRVHQGTPLREAVRALLEYIAVDVMHDAAVIIAAHVDNAAMGDSVAALLRPAFADTRTCVAEAQRNAGAQPVDVRLFYGPEIRTSCRSARTLAPNAVQAQLLVER